MITTRSHCFVCLFYSLEFVRESCSCFPFIVLFRNYSSLFVWQIMFSQQRSPRLVVTGRWVQWNESMWKLPLLLLLLLLLRMRPLLIWELQPIRLDWWHITNDLLHGHRQNHLRHRHQRNARSHRHIHHTVTILLRLLHLIIIIIITKVTITVRTWAIMSLNVNSPCCIIHNDWGTIQEAELDSFILQNCCPERFHPLIGKLLIQNNPQDCFFDFFHGLNCTRVTFTMSMELVHSKIRGLSVMYSRKNSLIEL